jgi:hypothetical protein
MDIFLDGTLEFDNLLLSDIVASNTQTGSDFDIDITLLEDGLLHIMLTQDGDAGRSNSFHGYDLTVYAETYRDLPSVVPEPSTLALFGLGLAASASPRAVARRTDPIHFEHRDGGSSEPPLSFEGMLTAALGHFRTCLEGVFHVRFQG